MDAREPLQDIGIAALSKASITNHGSGLLLTRAFAKLVSLRCSPFFSYGVIDDARVLNLDIGDSLHHSIAL
ncbi:hypothetical protein, partial [Vibrio anguillarum]|uniref:hypothetical protein n=1 Tax=Vibrio anguillarum TaxID=55601 RepID=UPI001BE47F7E